MDASFRDLLGRFAELGGIAVNICQREGEYGRGIFPVDPSCRAKIMTPKNLLVDASNIYVDGDEIVISNKNDYTNEEVRFLEIYYNDYSWGNNGNNDSVDFVKLVLALPESIKKKLLGYGFVDASFLSYHEGSDCILERFVSERAVKFAGKSVLAPVWEFVNHSPYAAPLRITAYGVETPPIEPSAGEILFKYCKHSSPISMWKKYGFACDCIVAYSIPFNINVGGHGLSVQCSGKLDLDPKARRVFSVSGNTLSIKSLPVGCLSESLPRENFRWILSSFSLSEDVADRLFLKICEINIKARSGLVDSLRVIKSGIKASLKDALTYEIELIENSSFW